MGGTTSRRRGARLLAMLTLATGVLVTGPARPAAGRSSDRSTVLSLLNRERRERGLGRLAMSEGVSEVAREHTRSMVERRHPYHTDDLRRALRRFEWDVAGENVGASPTLRDVHAAFMRSSGHRRNVLYGPYRTVGIGVVWRKDIVYVTVEFID